MINRNKIVVTGGNGRFAQSLRKIRSKYKFIYPTKNHLDITDWKAGNWKKLGDSYDASLYNKRYNPFEDVDDVDYGNGQWAVAACMRSQEAYSTPGFCQANVNHNWKGKK